MAAEYSVVNIPKRAAFPPDVLKYREPESFTRFSNHDFEE